METTAGVADSIHQSETASTGTWGISPQTGGERGYSSSSDETRLPTGAMDYACGDPVQTAEPSRFRRNGVSPEAIAPARRILDEIDLQDQYSTQLDLSSLRNCLVDMWKTASDCSDHHHEILAAAESALLSACQVGMLEPDQVAALQVALDDLAQPVLVVSHVETICERFVRAGFPALPFVDE